MVRPVICLALLSIFAFQYCYCKPSEAVPSDGDLKVAAPSIPPPPPVTPTTTKITTTGPTTPSPPPTTPSTSTPVPPTTTPITTKPTTSTISPTSSSTTVPTTPSSTSPAPSSTTQNPSSTSPSPSTTEHPNPPQPSDRKFDAMSFLGGFSLGLGLVAIGILSWRFYLSRQENYYHTL